MRKILLLIPILLITGCASSPWGTATSGGANYSYTKTAEGCNITINSARDVAGGNLTIGENCSVSVTAENAGGAGKAIDVIGSLVDKIK